MFKCWKCKQESMSDRVILGSSGYHCRLCCRCVNEWSIYVSTHAAYVLYARKEAEYQAVIASGDSKAASIVAVELLNAQRDLFHTAQLWCPAPAPEEKKQINPPTIPTDKA